jgi:hypothetical protein
MSTDRLPRIASLGRQLALDTGHGTTILLDGFLLGNVSWEQGFYESSWQGHKIQMPRSMRVEFSVASCGRVEHLDAESAEKVFFNPATASVEELLRLAHGKMDERSRREAKCSLL